MEEQTLADMLARDVRLRNEYRAIGEVEAEAKQEESVNIEPKAGQE